MAFPETPGASCHCLKRPAPDPAPAVAPPAGPPAAPAPCSGPPAPSLAHALTVALGRTQSSPSSPDHRDSPAAPAPRSQEPSLPKPLPYLNMSPTTVTIGQLDGADDAELLYPAAG
jgi:hypothetical protein